MRNTQFEKYLEKQLRRIRKKYRKITLNKDDYYLTMTIMTYGGRKEKLQHVILANNRTYKEDKNNQVNITIFE